MFVVLEGADGVGKTTQINKLVDELDRLDYNVIMTREPGGTPVGRQIREIIMGEVMSQKTQALLFLADRAEHYDKVIKPNILAGNIVLQDRYIDSTLVYQGVIGKLGTQIVAQMSVWAVDMFMPDLIITLDGENKRDVPEDRFHEFNVENQSRIRKLFKTLAGSRGLTDNTVRVLVNGDRPIELVTAEILSHILDRLAASQPIAEIDSALNNRVKRD